MKIRARKKGVGECSCDRSLGENGIIHARVWSTNSQFLKFGFHIFSQGKVREAIA
ncbi:MAG: hypothetical protein V7K89_03780 [Nostoc sp.]|uniref:hypothetical protein n=1 Tax=Nostoc sp. TaxID=1180 RepID=UPI002FF44E15